MLGLVVRSLAAGPAYDARPKDHVAAERTVAPPKGQADERAPLPRPGAIGGGRHRRAEPSARPASPAPSAGVIDAIKVKEGDHVAEGDVLLTLESGVEVAAVKTAEADVANAQGEPHADAERAADRGPRRGERRRGERARTLGAERHRARRARRSSSRAAR